jgi:hypothetical protein
MKDPRQAKPLVQLGPLMPITEQVHDLQFAESNTAWPLDRGMGATMTSHKRGGRHIQSPFKISPWSNRAWHTQQSEVYLLRSTEYSTGRPALIVVNGFGSVFVYAQPSARRVPQQTQVKRRGWPYSLWSRRCTVQ